MSSSAPTQAQSAALSSAQTREMESHGIVRVPVDYFHIGEFRYTSLKDAVAQAERLENLGRLGHSRLSAKV